MATHSHITSGYQIRFQDKNFRLSIEALKKQAGAKPASLANWRSPSLKFLSFHKGKLTLLNTSANRSFKLILQVTDAHLYVGCSCSSKRPSICEHALAGVYWIIMHMGERYFEKLRPLGLMEIAFAHKKYFDRRESVAGLDVTARPELPSIYKIAPKVENPDLAAVFKLPPPRLKLPMRERTTVPNDLPDNTETMAYLLIVAANNRFLPALMPCMGILNAKRTVIKTFHRFLSGLQKTSDHLRTDCQKNLNTNCQNLWKLIEKQQGIIVPNKPAVNAGKGITDIFTAWHQIIPLLQKQRFIYSYDLYGTGELRGKPKKHRIKPIILLGESPELRFAIKDSRHFYRLEMQVWLHKKQLAGCNAGTTFFINHQQTHYLMGSLRDAAIAQWMHLSGDCICIFKEHFAQFEMEILKPLQQFYQVELPGTRKTKNK